jgi:hypothetical protein
MLVDVICCEEQRGPPPRRSAARVGEPRVAEGRPAPAPLGRAAGFITGAGRLLNSDASPPGFVFGSPQGPPRTGVLRRFLIGPAIG